MAAAAGPMPKNSTNGARYANVGMICITSRIGEMSRGKRSLRAARIPSGTPIAKEIATAAMIAPRVSTLESHSPRRPSDEEAGAGEDRRSASHPPGSPMAPAIAMSAGQPIAVQERRRQPRRACR